MSTAAAAELESEVEIHASPLSVLETQTRGEIDIQIATAKKWPRSIKQFKETAMEMATLDEDTAASCIYALPRADKTIEGPSARLAEIILCAWGNSRAGARTISDEGNFVTAQGAFHDLERNIAISFEVRRRIVDKRGRRYGDDMIGTTANAACSIALRNAVLKGVPKAFWQPIYEAAKKTAIGDAKTLANRRADMLAYFQKLGATNEKVFALLGVKGADDITLEHLFTLKGLATAIKEGDTTVDDAFMPPEKPKTTTTIDDLDQSPGHAPEDENQDAAAEPIKRGPGRPKKFTEKQGKDSPAWAEFDREYNRCGHNFALEEKERIGLVNVPFDRLTTAQLLALTSELKKFKEPTE